MPSRLLGGLLLLVVAGCTSYSGVVEFNAYRDAFVTTEQTSDGILDKLAVAERDLFKLCANRQRISSSADCAEFDPEIDSFHAEDAPFIASVGDPPATAAFRRMIKAVRAYSDALNGLANGATAESMASKMSELAGLGTSAASAIAGDAGAAGGPVGAGVVTAAATSVNTAVAAFKPIATAFLGFRARSVFREELQARAPDIRRAMEKARDGSEVIFQALQDQIVLGTDDELTDRDRQQILANRQLLANWVVNAAAVAARRNLAGATN